MIRRSFWPYLFHNFSITMPNNRTKRRINFAICLAYLLPSVMLAQTLETNIQYTGFEHPTGERYFGITNTLVETNTLDPQLPRLKQMNHLIKKTE